MSDTENNIGNRDKEQMNEGKKVSAGKKTAVIICSAVIVILFAAFLAFNIIKAIGRKDLKDNIEELDVGSTVTYNGKEYVYNDEVITLLCMGIDRYVTVDELDPTSPGQADVIFLVVLDEKNKDISFISVNRDTMVEVDVYNSEGEIYESRDMQLTMQYAYAWGGEQSGNVMMKKVSELFGGIPINAYAAIHLQAVAEVNDAVGGVTVTIPENDPDYTAETGFPPGSTVTLMGEAATQFIRSRNEYTEFSNQIRMARQKQYLVSFTETLAQKTREDITTPLKIYDELTPYINSNISMTSMFYLAADLSKYGFTEENIYSVPGYNEQPGAYVEFIVDKEGLHELILDVFYEEV